MESSILGHISRQRDNGIQIPFQVAEIVSETVNSISRLITIGLIVPNYIPVSLAHNLEDDVAVHIPERAKVNISPP